MKGRVPRRYHFLIEKDVGEHIKMEPRALQRWIQMTEPVLRKVLRMMSRRTRASKRIEAWLRWRRRRRRIRRQG